MSVRKSMYFPIVFLLFFFIGPAAGAVPDGASNQTGSSNETDPAGAYLPPASDIIVDYAGQLNGPGGRAVDDGAYDLAFSLYLAAEGDEPLWSELHEGVMLVGGRFDVLLGSLSPLPDVALDSDRYWLSVSVRGPGDSEFTSILTPQPLSSAGSTSAGGTAGLTCPHDHILESWEGVHPDYTFRVSNTGQGDAIRAIGSTDVDGYASLWARNFSSGNAVIGHSNTGHGVYAISGGMGRNQAALRALAGNTTNGMAAYFSNSSAYHTAHLFNSGPGGVLYLQNNGDTAGNGGGDFITARNNLENDTQFRITSNGSVYSDGTWNTPAQDFAELLPAGAGLEPGDVLAIGPDGSLALSGQPYQTSVAGVYSTQPGFLGGQPVTGEVEGSIPLALLGVVPAKVSAENGPILPGDLLVTSTTPGHAMKAGPNPPQGTVLGKAMGALETGASTIRILVTLQ